MKKTIVKCQLSLATTLNTPQVLVYNEKHTIHYQTPCDDNWKKIFGDKFKVFRYAHTRADGVLSIDEPAPWQDW